MIQYDLKGCEERHKRIRYNIIWNDTKSNDNTTCQDMSVYKLLYDMTLFSMIRYIMTGNNIFSLENF